MSLTQSERPEPWGAREEWIEDPVRISRILAVAEENRRRVVFRGADGERVVGRWGDLCWRADRALVAGVRLSSPVTCTLDLVLGVASFTVDESKRVPSRVHRSRARDHVRITCERTVRVWLRGDELETTTMNVSREGLALIEPREVEVGDRARVETDSTPPLFAIVRHVSAEAGTVGLELESPRAAQPSWDEYIRSARGWRTEENQASADEVYTLFERAGYLETGPSALSVSRESYLAAFDKRRRAPELAVQHSWPDADGLVYSLSGVRLYSRAWFGFHLAKRPGDCHGASKRELLRSAITEHHEALLQRPSADFVCTYIRDDARWSKLAFHEFASRYVPAKLAAQHAIVPWSFATTEPVPVSVDATVRRATSDERDQVAAWFARHHSQVFCAALDLGAEALAMDEIVNSWRSHGMDRAREVWSARRGDQQAYAISERVEPGVHFFEVLNSVRLLGDPELWPALLEYARTHFFAPPLARFVALVEPTARHDFAERGGTSLGKAVLNIYSREVIADLLEHVWELCGVGAETMAP